MDRLVTVVKSGDRAVKEESWRWLGIVVSGGGRRGLCGSWTWSGPAPPAARSARFPTIKRLLGRENHVKMNLAWYEVDMGSGIAS